MVTRGEIYWADLEAPVGRRPVCVLTRTRAASVLTGIVFLYGKRTDAASIGDVDEPPVTDSADVEAA